MAMRTATSGKRVAILTFSEVTRDPRIKRAAELMVARGHEVRVYTFQFESRRASENYAGFQIIRLPRPKSWLDTDGFCSALKDLSPLIHSLWPDILSGLPPTQSGLGATAAPNGPVVRRAACLEKYVQRLLPRPRPPTANRPSALLEDGYTKAVRDVADTRERMQLNLDLYRAVGSWATHVYANDLETLFAGVMLKQAQAACLLYDAHEIWPQQWAADYRSAQFVGFYSTLERILLRQTDVRITVGHGLASYFEQAYGCAPVTVIPNTPSIKYLVDESVVRRRSNRRGILYHGLYMAFRGLDEIIRVIPLLADARIAFRGLGGYEPTLHSLANELGVSRLEFLPAVPTEELVGLASDFDIGLLPFIDVCLNTSYAFPNKLFEYMMAGLAIATSDLIDQKRLVLEHEMGIVFDIKDTEQVAGQLNMLLRTPDLLDEMRYNAWRAARDIYNWEMCSTEFAKILATCCL